MAAQRVVAPELKITESAVADPTLALPVVVVPCVSVAIPNRFVSAMAAVVKTTDALVPDTLVVNGATESRSDRKKTLVFGLNRSRCAG